MKRNHSYCLILFLLFTLQVDAQEQHLQIAAKLKEYCTQVPWHDVYVHTDRSTYIAGEDMWFKVYCVDRQSGNPAPDIIAYFELLSIDNRPVIRKRIRLENGSGPDQIVLPDTLSTGIYRIRAYTNRMKNFMPENCFLMQINVFNAFSRAEIRPTIPSNEYKNKYSLLLETDNQRADSLIINVTGQSQRISESYSLIIHSRGNISYNESVKIKALPARIAVSKRSLLQGVSHITLFDDLQKPVAERFSYIPVRPVDFNVVLPEQSGRREKIIPTFGQNEYANLSIRVAPAGSGTVSILDYMIFGSEFGPAFHERIKAIRQENLTASFIDSILEGAESKWIRWDKVMQDKPDELTYKPEVSAHFIQGSLIGDNPAGKFVLMSQPGKQAYFQYAVADARGNFAFSLPADGEQRDIIIQPDEISDKISIKMTSPFFEEYETGTEAGNLPPVKYPGAWSTGYQVAKIYGTRYAAPSAKLLTPALPTRRFYGKPDVELVLDDYIKLPLMEEIFYEIIPGANLRKRRTGYEITIADPVTKMTYDAPPSLFVDGVRIDNADIIAGIDPEYVEQIDVVLEKHIVGEYIFQGIVNVVSKKADLSIIELPRYALRTGYRVFEQAAAFTSPSYSEEKSRSSRIPDFRNTIYWNPEGSAASEFWTSDVPGEYEIDIQGITPGGRLISQKRTFTVR